MNKITRKDYKGDFDELIDDFTDTSYHEHRRGSTFFTRGIIEIDESYFPELDRSLDGFWETNTYIWSDEDWDKRDIIELNRVEIREKVVTTKEWVKIEG